MTKRGSVAPPDRQVHQAGKALRGGAAGGARARQAALGETSPDLPVRGYDQPPVDELLTPLPDELLEYPS